MLMIGSKIATFDLLLEAMPFLVISNGFYVCRILGDKY